MLELNRGYRKARKYGYNDRGEELSGKGKKERHDNFFSAFKKQYYHTGGKEKWRPVKEFLK